MTSSNPINVLGICGSLRKASVNGALLRCAQRCAPDTMQVHPSPISQISLYTIVMENDEKGFPLL